MRRIKGIALLVMATAGLITASCTNSAPSQLVCERLKGKTTRGFTSTGAFSEEKIEYKWWPIIKIDRANKTVLLAASHDEGVHANHPRIMNYVENSGVLRFGQESESAAQKYHLDLNQMKVSLSDRFSEDGFWSETDLQARCSSLSKPPEIIYN
jgi:hypothetical protein